MFTRDERRLPFVPVTVAAMDAIRAAVPKGRPYATATYMALLELANERRGDRAAVTHAALIEMVGAGRTTIKDALANLVAAGVLELREQTHGRGRIENEYVIVEPPDSGDVVSDTLSRQATDPPSPNGQPVRARPSQPSAAQAEGQTEEEGQKSASAVQTVFDEWIAVTERPPARTKLTPERRGTIKRAVASHGLDDCLAAVRNIGRSEEARSGYGRGTRFDDVKHALGSAERIEKWRDWQPPTAPGQIGRGGPPTNGDLLRALDAWQHDDNTIEGTAHDLDRRDSHHPRSLAGGTGESAVGSGAAGGVRG